MSKRLHCNFRLAESVLVVYYSMGQASYSYIPCIAFAGLWFEILRYWIRLMYLHIFMFFAEVSLLVVPLASIILTTATAISSL